jgi:hypothetical protein
MSPSLSKSMDLRISSKFSWDYTESINAYFISTKLRRPVLFLSNALKASLKLLKSISFVILLTRKVNASTYNL